MQLSPLSKEHLSIREETSLFTFTQSGLVVLEQGEIDKHTAAILKNRCFKMADGLGFDDVDFDNLNEEQLQEIMRLASPPQTEDSIFMAFINGVLDFWNR